ncbi:branched-chain amino acid ABC transporter permease [Thermus scotoductus]|uniref:Branched-chain amino acid ABC transporter permease n=1 Tax=Thermus scotoductus TaxID=37636 RepID=A0A430SA72_THESC|nr:branched-chain amino acid ABC transporter permease [Thermus scotoductus]RTG96011.1 branched-chain amino acid ABC transporter permease [Thermus scotoductus]RTH06306.1 branched-chain amino acid ABC transporter permease [Thermus scotoductus]RTH09076.1 branched-chain amino acid ABC transporter permease [Thermus scotoductus]RTH09295.1 branched-chain amino acid ABC transporter permease [Thermus scotoductus]RTH18073.1 branched-chain amino acid ABC transporter permease [Thermus scotoductus]
MRRSLLLFLPFLFALLPFLPLGVWRAFLLDAGLFVLLYTALALSWDLVARTGQLSLAHGAFFGLGAYGAGLLVPHLGTLPGLVLGSLLAGLGALVLGSVTLRLHGLYFAIASLAFSEVLRTLALKLPFTGGPIGLPVPPPFGGASPWAAYYLALAVFLLALALSLWAEWSPFRLAQAACRQSEAVARVLGVRVVRVKLWSLFLGSVVAGLAGGVYGMKTLFLSPYDAFSLARAVEALVIPIFGGLYTTLGPLLGGVALVSLEQALRLWIQEGYLVIYGAILILVILFLPRGLVGVLGRRRG